MIATHAASATRERAYKLSSAGGVGYSSFVRTRFDERSVDLLLFRLLHDEPAKAPFPGEAPSAAPKRIDGKVLLESYFNDLYKMFVRRLSSFECTAKASDEEQTRLKALLDELIRVKGMLYEADGGDLL